MTPSRHVVYILTFHRQGVGILCAVDRKLLDIEDSNQDFLTRNLQKIHERLQGLFSRFLDEQIRAIEDTKVKIKKRKGVIAFMKTFPHFSVATENMLPPASDGGDQLEIRRMVDDGYQRINKAMFESLKVIAKESPAVMASQGQGDPEDKEALNYHILLIENMNHYIEEVDARSDQVLDYWKGKAHDEYNEHMSLYVDAVIRRPLGKLLVRNPAVPFPSSAEKPLTNTTGIHRIHRNPPHPTRRQRPNHRPTLLALPLRLQKARPLQRRQRTPQGHRGAQKARRQALWRRRRPDHQPRPRLQGAQGVREEVRRGCGSHGHD